MLRYIYSNVFFLFNYPTIIIAVVYDVFKRFPCLAFELAFNIIHSRSR